MPHRDPQTGKFVPSVDEAGDAWDELHKTVVRKAYIYDATDSSQADSNIQAPDSSQIDPAGGLDRTEIAELVALHLQYFYVDQLGGGTQGTQPGRAKFLYGLSLGSDSLFVDPDDDQYRVDRTDIGDSNTPYLDSSEWVVDGVAAQQYLAHWESSLHAGFNDTTNGTGGGASSTMHPLTHINYRREFGRGPLMDHTDQLHEHLQFNIDNMENQHAACEIGYFLYWDVHEAEELDIPGFR